MRIFSIGKDFHISDSGISTVEIIEINGIKQAILIQAEPVVNPVLLFFHGGPSMPIPGVSSRSRDYTVATTTKDLVKHYVLVFWDQRGTGKSYHPDIPIESMNLKQFVSDAEGVVDYLRKRFNRAKILIAGHSWGSIIGLYLASRIPNKLLGYVGISQIVNWSENDRLCREWAIMKARQKRIKKAIQELTQLGEPPYKQSFRQWGVLRKWLMKFNSMIYTDNTVKHPGLKRVILDMLRSPDYSIKDIYNTFYKGFRLSYTQQMIEDFSTVDFIKSTPRLDIPVYFIHGTKDVHVFGSQVQKYFDILDARKGKYLIWEDKSSHMFHPDDAREIEKTLIDIAKMLNNDNKKTEDHANI